jgi:hypothetical protein
MAGSVNKVILVGNLRAQFRVVTRRMSADIVNTPIGQSVFFR